MASQLPSLPASQLIHIAYIAIGSNLGDKGANCRRGIEAVAGEPQCRLLAQAPCYRTAPVGYQEQDWFINTLVKIETELDPWQLLERLRRIEAALGKEPPPVRFGPRVLDLDIVMYDDRVIASPELEIPHPRMHERRFVLVPFCDIDPEVVHPVLGERMRDLLSRLDNTEQEVDPYPCDC